MLISELIKELENRIKEDGDQQIFISNDPEGNEIRVIDFPYNYELEKENNDGTYDCVVIFPTHEIKNQ